MQVWVYWKVILLLMSFKQLLSQLQPFFGVGTGLQMDIDYKYRKRLEEFIQNEMLQKWCSCTKGKDKLSGGYDTTAVTSTTSRMTHLITSAQVHCTLRGQRENLPPFWTSNQDGLITHRRDTRCSTLVTQWPDLQWSRSLDAPARSEPQDWPDLSSESSSTRLPTTD